MIEYGKVSYFADKFHGRTTVCKDRYEQNPLTEPTENPFRDMGQLIA